MRQESKHCPGDIPFYESTPTKRGIFGKVARIQNRKHGLAGQEKLTSLSEHLYTTLHFMTSVMPVGMVWEQQCMPWSLKKPK